LIKEEYFDKDSVLYFEKRFVYDNYGNSINEDLIYYNSTMSNVHIINECVYSENGLLISKSVFYKPNVMSRKIEYKYDMKGNLIEEVTINPQYSWKYTRKFRYNKNKLKYYKYERGLINEYEIYLYNDNNLLRERIYVLRKINSNCKYIIKYFYQYY
jgi:hypothetical protein